jgi:hypothetical protein
LVNNIHYNYQDSYKFSEKNKEFYNYENLENVSNTINSYKSGLSLSKISINDSKIKIII